MLEVKIILHHAGTGVSSDVANMTITQVEKGDGHARAYRVEAWRQPELTRGRLMSSGLVIDHDRTQSVFELLRAACEELRPR